MTLLPNCLPCTNFYKVRQICDDIFLVTVDSGEWVVLSKKELMDLKEENFANSDFFNVLRENHIFLDQSNWENYLGKLKIRWDEVFSPPSLHIVVVTPQCNLRCIYCHASKNHNSTEYMSIETAQKVLEKIISISGDNITLEFQGGEPTLNFEIIQFLVREGRRLAKKHGKILESSIVTNFTESLTDEKIRFLITNDVAVSTSIDGPAEVHENNRNRNYPNGFSILSERIMRFREIWHEERDGEPSLSALLTATKMVLDKPQETVDTYISLGFDNLFIRPINPLGRGGRETVEFSYSPEDFVKYWENIVCYIIELWLRGIQITESHLSLLLMKIFHRDNGYMDLRFPCGAAYGQRTYNYDGKIYTCDEGRMLHEQNFCIGSVNDSKTELNNSLKGVRTFESSLAELSFCEFCAYKPFCGVCPLLNWKERGNINTTIWKSRRCSLYSGMLDVVFKKFIMSKKAQKVFGDMVVKEV